MKIIADENIAFAEKAFSKFGEVSLLNGREITNDILKNADIVVVRSITKVDEKLLSGTPIKFVGTATIGIDHIDIGFLKKNNIAFTDAKGCNADSVAEYFLTALLKIVNDRKFKIEGKSIGIIGVGNVGSRVARISEALGLKVFKNDPPRERAGDGEGYVSLEQALKADIITFHVPLNKSGADKTYHLLDSEKIDSLKPGSILINTSRGPVINNTALLNKIEEKNLAVCLDVWEGEPLINTELLKLVNIASAHIAGYSLEGKVNATRIIFDALCAYLNEGYNWSHHYPPASNSRIELRDGNDVESKLRYIVRQIYDINRDDKLIRKMIEMNEEGRMLYFDRLRNEYSFRREFTNYTVVLKSDDKRLVKMLRKLRFNIRYED